jgi:predicted nicotinamide N-methyase
MSRTDPDVRAATPPLRRRELWSAYRVRVHTQLTPVAFVPEVRLYQAAGSAGLFDDAAGEYRSDRPPPFWAFAWPGGQALARYVLDHPRSVAGLRVADLGTGSGLVAIAAALAGAAEVRAVDVDPAALTAVARNAAANGVRVTGVREDLGDFVTTGGAGLRASGQAGGTVDVVLAGDVCYTGSAARTMLAALRRAGRDGARVLVADPGRGYFPGPRFRSLAGYDVPVRPVLEDVPVRRTTVWELPGPAVTPSRSGRCEP